MQAVTTPRAVEGDITGPEQVRGTVQIHAGAPADDHVELLVVSVGVLSDGRARGHFDDVDEAERPIGRSVDGSLGEQVTVSTVRHTRRERSVGETQNRGCLRAPGLTRHGAFAGRERTASVATSLANPAIPTV